MKNIDEIILQHSTRGMDKLYNKINKELCLDAVENFLTLKKGVVFIYTGFYVDGFCETDGPIGTYFLSKALKDLGMFPIIITDKYCKDFFKDQICIYVDKDISDENYYENLISDYEPVAHFSIERCGKNKEAKYINSKGEDISTYTVNLDELFTLGSKSAVSFSIGDGGNEIGMGNIKDLIYCELNINSCVVKSDNLILASVSNWGAYGFIAYLEKYLKKDLLPSFFEVDSYLNYILSLGAVDGISKLNEKSVDGKDWSLEKDILRSLKSVILK